jgi:hypothetical protein
MGDVGDRGEVGDVRRAVGDMGERDQRGLLADLRGDLLGLGTARRVGLKPVDRQAMRVRQGLKHIPVGGKVRRVGEDPGAPRPGGDRGRRELVEADGRRVGKHNLSLGRPQQVACEQVAGGERELHPPLRPAADQPLTPLVVDRVTQRIAGLQGHLTQ